MHVLTLVSFEIDIIPASIISLNPTGCIMYLAWIVMMMMLKL